MSRSEAISCAPRKWNDMTIIGLAVSVGVPLFFLCLSWRVLIAIVRFSPHGLLDASGLGASFLSVGTSFLSGALFVYLLQDLVLRGMSVDITEHGVFRSARSGRAGGIEWTQVKRITLADLWVPREEILWASDEVLITDGRNEITFSRCLFPDDYSLLTFLRERVAEEAIDDPSRWDRLMQEESARSAREARQGSWGYRMCKAILASAGGCVMLVILFIYIIVTSSFLRDVAPWLPREVDGYVAAVLAPAALMLTVVYLGRVIRWRVWGDSSRTARMSGSDSVIKGDTH